MLGRRSGSLHSAETRNAPAFTYNAFWAPMAAINMPLRAGPRELSYGHGTLHQCIDARELVFFYNERHLVVASNAGPKAMENMAITNTST